MTGRQFETATADDATLTAGGAQMYAGGWAARIIPTGPVPTHLTDCALATFGFPAEVCACTRGTEWLRTRNTALKAVA